MSPFITLDVADGPPCPRCGCQDVEILQRPDPETKSWWPQGRARCRFCRLLFQFRELPASPAAPADNGNGPLIADVEEATATRYPVRGCPRCGSADTIVSSSPRAKNGAPRVRRHRCRNCGEAFKSVDSRQKTES